jgi:hypothetical protein
MTISEWLSFPSNGEQGFKPILIRTKPRQSIVNRGARPWRIQSSFTSAAKAPIPEGFWP